MISKPRLLLWIAVTPAVLLCIAPFAWNAWTGHVLEAAQARCRAAGLPMALREIIRPPLADADNAAPLLEKIAALTKEETFAGAHDDGVMEQIGDFRQAHPELRLDASAASELARLLDRPDVEAILALAREAARRRGCDAHVDYSLGPAVKLPLLTPQLDSLKLLAAHARLAASRQQAEVACADLWAMFRLAEFPARELTLITQLTRVAGEGITIEALEKTVAEGCVPPDWAERFSAHLRGLEITREFVRSVDGERLVFGTWLFDRFIAGDSSLSELTGTGTGGASPITRLGLRYTYGRFCRLDYAFYLDRMRIARTELANVAQGEAAQAAHLQKNSEGIPRYYLLTAITLPTLAAVSQKIAQTRAMIDVAVAGLALERYYARHNRYPESLAALAPEFLKETPRDIFTDGPPVYRHWDGGAIVYSVGPNRRDDHGVSDFKTSQDDRAWHAGTAERAPPTTP